jgi:glycerophosphoryl diester phosphodiesterase
MLQLPNVDRPPRGHGLRPREHACESFREARSGAGPPGSRSTSSSPPTAVPDPHARLLPRDERPGIDRLVSRDARGPSCRRRRADAASRRSPAFGELGLGCNVEIKPCEGRAADTAQGHRRDPPSPCGRPRCRRRCCRASRTGRPAHGPTRTAPELARGTADRRGGGRLVWPAPRRWRPPASTPTASCLTAPSARSRSAKPATSLSVYTINDGDVARALVGMGVRLRHHRRAGRHPARRSASIEGPGFGGCVRGDSLGGLSPDRNKTDTVAVVRPDGYIAGDSFWEVCST